MTSEQLDLLFPVALVIGIFYARVRVLEGRRRPRPTCEDEGRHLPSHRLRIRTPTRSEELRFALNQTGDISRRRDKHLPARVYLVQRGSAYKVGITSLSARRDRVERHVENGWSRVKTWDVSSLTVAREIELKVLKHWRLELGLRPVPIAMPQGGRSETASLLCFGTDSTLSLIDRSVESQGVAPLKVERSIRHS